MGFARWIALAALAVPLAFASPLLAWTFGVDGPLCTLTHSENGTDVDLTYDPSLPLYTITVTRPGGWPDAAIFGLRFDGPAPLTITTNRQMLSEDGTALTVADVGFGNVLSGLEGNVMATAFSGDALARVTLDGAAPAVAAFRACGQIPAV